MTPLILGMREIFHSKSKWKSRGFRIGEVTLCQVMRVGSMSNKWCVVLDQKTWSNILARRYLYSRRNIRELPWPIGAKIFKPVQQVWRHIYNLEDFTNVALVLAGKIKSNIFRAHLVLKQLSKVCLGIFMTKVKKNIVVLLRVQ